MRILLVEDYPPLAEAVADSLHRAGLTVDHAGSMTRADGSVVQFERCHDRVGGRIRESIS